MANAPTGRPTGRHLPFTFTEYCRRADEIIMRCGVVAAAELLRDRQALERDALREAIGVAATTLAAVDMTRAYEILGGCRFETGTPSRVACEVEARERGISIREVYASGAATIQRLKLDAIAKESLEAMAEGRLEALEEKFQAKHLELLAQVSKLEANELRWNARLAELEDWRKATLPRDLQDLGPLNGLRSSVEALVARVASLEAMGLDAQATAILERVKVIEKVHPTQAGQAAAELGEKLLALDARAAKLEETLADNIVGSEVLESLASLAGSVERLTARAATLELAVKGKLERVAKLEMKVGEIQEERSDVEEVLQELADELEVPAPTVLEILSEQEHRS